MRGPETRVPRSVMIMDIQVRCVILTDDGARIKFTYKGKGDFGPTGYQDVLDRTVICENHTAHFMNRAPIWSEGDIVVPITNK
jgi:hypothetical protein